MNKSDYDINCNMDKANKKAKGRWQRLLVHTVEMHSVYDIRLDEKQHQNFNRWLINTKLEELFTSQYIDHDWTSLVKPLGFEIKIFSGFINRLLQEKDKSYTVELKDTDQKSFDIETGWFAFTGLNPLVPEAKKCYKYTYQPYIPGNAVRVTYLDIDQPDSKWPMKVKLHAQVENNIFTQNNNV